MENCVSPEKWFHLTQNTEEVLCRIENANMANSQGQIDSNFVNNRCFHSDDDAMEKIQHLTEELEETRTACKILIGQRRKDQNEIEEVISANVQELIMPFVQKLKNMNLNRRQKEIVNVIEYNLQKITSPFIRNLTSGNIGLTPREIEIANLIRHGRTSKEIAETLSMSKTTIDTHRYNIRKKCGIQNKKVNLRSRLLALQYQ